MNNEGNHKLLELVKTCSSWASICKKPQLNTILHASHPVPPVMPQTRGAKHHAPQHVQSGIPSSDNIPLELVLGQLQILLDMCQFVTRNTGVLEVFNYGSTCCKQIFHSSLGEQTIMHH